MPRRKLLSRSVLGVLRSGFRDPRHHLCLAQRDLSGAPLNQLLLYLSNNGLVEVQWTSSLKAGDPIGVLTERGDEAFRRGYL